MQNMVEDNDFQEEHIYSLLYLIFDLNNNTLNQYYVMFSVEQHLTAVDPSFTYCF